MSRYESDTKWFRRASRLAVIVLEGYRLIGQRSYFKSPKQPGNRKPQLSFCEVDGRTNPAAARSSYKTVNDGTNQIKTLLNVPRTERPMVPIHRIGKVA